MNITPFDIRSQEFSGAVSGYNRREVKQFLENLSSEYEQMLVNANELQTRIQHLEVQLGEMRSGEDDLKRAVISAGQIAHQMKENAQREAEIIKREAEAIREQAERDAQAILDQARKRADELLREANLDRDRMFSEAHAKVQEMQTGLEQVKSEKAQFLAQYRAMLKAFLELSAKHPE